MKKKKHSNNRLNSGGFDPMTDSNDFYSGSPTERPLYQDRRKTDMNRVRKTARHQDLTGRRKEAADLREKMALIAIMKATIILIVLIILFFALWKGIGLYEEKVFVDNLPDTQGAPLLNPLQGLGEMDVNVREAGAPFSERIEQWKKAERIVDNVDNLLLRDNIDQAIIRCQEALEVAPMHMGALERIARLYFDQKMYAEAVNTYVRMLGVEPSRSDLQVDLLKALNMYGDPDATIAVGQWYHEKNMYNGEVQRYLANAFFLKKEYAEAAEAYAVVIAEKPGDSSVLENQAICYMELKEYQKALDVLEQQALVDLRDPDCYKRMTFCFAQLGKEEDVVQTLGRSAHLFGADAVAMWIQDPRLDPVRMDRSFQIFADSVVTEEYRKYLERMAQTMENAEKAEIAPQLDLPDRTQLDPELLKPRQ
ncbi:MAG: tetratricopeptide repeat protein [Pontiellaceae bacterium]|nr:tetratricopeptide repeat protein [Pontiellaceae bacterium]MBN2784413.1 tetratricopeptide repeat protein [Pontiellaceae bacterium]